MEKNSKQKLTEDQKAVRKMLEQERAWAKKLEKIDDNTKEKECDLLLKIIENCI